MNKEEFIGKLQLVYVGDRNAFNEIVEDNQKLKNEIIYAKTEIDRLNDTIEKKNTYYDNLAVDYRIEQEKTDRLNNIINELEKYIKENSIYYNTSDGCQWVDQFKVLNKLKELKENNKWN